MTPSTRASSGAGRWRERRRHRERPARRASASTAAASPRASPTSRRCGSAAAAASWNAARRSSTEKSLVDEAVREADERERRPARTARARRAGRAPSSAASRRYGAPQRQRALRERDEQREDQCEVAELGDHRFASFSVGMLDRLVLLRRFERRARFRRHVVLVVLGEHLGRLERAVAPSVPCATTPLPSLNRSGRRPL